MTYPELGKKTVNVNEPYAIYTNEEAQWEWRVLKSWQNDNDKPFARWFCAVKSPYTYDSYDLGDTYVKDIVSHGALMPKEEMEEHLKNNQWKDYSK